MTFLLTVSQIADLCRSPLKNVERNWPILEQILTKFGMTHDAVMIAALATVATEARVFEPINEYGGIEYFTQMYDIESRDNRRVEIAKALGNMTPGDGAKYHGRGFIQTTGRHNYAALSRILNQDLLTHPELLLQPLEAAIALAYYFHTHAVDMWALKAFYATKKSCKYCPSGLISGHRPPLVPNDDTCSTCCWKTVRRLVNGGLNGWTVFTGTKDLLIHQLKLNADKELAQAAALTVALEKPGAEHILDSAVVAQTKECTVVQSPEPCQNGSDILDKHDHQLPQPSVSA